MKTFGVAAALAALCVVPTSAGAVTLAEIAAAMGTAKVQSLQLTGSGKSWIVGQQFEPSGPYPEAQVPRYARSEDYAGSAIALDYALVQPAPVKGGGGLAIGTENARKMGLKGDRAWSFAGPNATTAPQLVGQLQTELWTSPHGIVKAAMADGATVTDDTFEIARPGRLPEIVLPIHGPMANGEALRFAAGVK